MNKTTKILFAIVFLVALGGYAFPRVKNVVKKYGAEGDTNITNLVASGYATISGAITGSGATLLSSTTTLTGTNRITQPVEVGTKTILAGGIATTTVTAAQICANSYFEWAPSVANATATLPTAAALSAACLTTTGDRLPYIVWKNTSASASSTIFAAGASTTIAYANATTTAGGSQSILLGGKYTSLRFLVSSSSDPTSGVTVLISQFQ